MRETKIEAHLRKEVAKLGGWAVKLAPTRSGLPDRLVVLPFKPPLFVELKRPGGIVSPIQKHTHRQLSLMGHPVSVLWTIEDVDQWIDENRSGP
jgi:hypothetical protein